MPMRMLSLKYFNQLLLRAFRAKSPDQVRELLGMLGCSEESRSSLPEPFVEVMFRMFDLPTYPLAWLSLMETVLNLRSSKKQYVLGPADLGQVEQPTLFVWGNDDVFGGVEVGQQAEAMMPNAELRVIAGSHVPNIDNPVECARLTSQYLRQRDAPSLTLASQTRAAG